VPLHPLQTEWDADLTGGDPLGFPGYGGAPTPESVLTGRTDAYALIEGRFDVLGGSMGTVHGERVVRAYRRAVDERLPVVVLASSGGARMQEGMLSLIQMARCSGAARAHGEAGLLSMAIFRHPTTGGVLASYASLADVRAAVAGATVGFAGPRVVEMTTGQRVPEGSHTAESAYRAGLVDHVVPEDEQQRWVDVVLGRTPSPLPPGGRWPHEVAPDEESAWSEVLLARSAERLTGLDWAAVLFSSWADLRGADPVVRGGLATFEGNRLVVVATDRRAGEGRPGPAGYRLAQRCAALAGRLGLPLLTLVDTPGADPGPESEAGGVAGEIARTFAALDAVPGPTISVCVGEGGSGGALALAHTDRLLILRHAIFSVIGPEGAAAILERDPSKAAEVAAKLKLTSVELLDLGIVDEVLAEDEESVRSGLRAGLREAEAGDRRRRIDDATRRWVG
jgi:acetyl-CoA carboxylase carboxyl transferase subunit beta